VKLAARAAHWMATFSDNEAAWPRVVFERGRPVIYATWLTGGDYRNAAASRGFYGAYPRGYLERVAAFFPDVRDGILHAFSGSLPTSPVYVRLDTREACTPDVVGSVYDVAALFRPFRFKLIYADPPYSAADAERYGTAGVDRLRATRALAEVTVKGGHLVWLDTCWPQFDKTQWTTVMRITLIRSCNHRVRLVSVFERGAA